MIVLATEGSKHLMTTEIKDEVMKQDIFFNDVDSYHWFFDFKVGDVWVSSKYISNDFKECVIELFKP